MTVPYTRRRFLAVSAAAFSLSASTARSAPPVARWRGRALGAEASLQLVGLDGDEAAPVLAAVQREIYRLEGIFSLYRPGSEISQLNRSGHLDAPSPDLLEVLGMCAHLHAATEGAFDPTVQPLFALVAAAALQDRPPRRDALREAASRVGFDGVQFNALEVHLGRTGAALTLNGIAQGHVTDRIGALLRSHGLTDVLIDMGEILALGDRPGGGAWRTGIADPTGTLVRRLSLSDRALATSAPKGTILDPTGRRGHIFDPATGREAGGCALVSVSGPSAAMADGLSTGLCVLPPARHAPIAARCPGARIEYAI